MESWFRKLVKAKFPDKEVYYAENVNDLPEKVIWLPQVSWYVYNHAGAGNIYTAGESW